MDTKVITINRRNKLSFQTNEAYKSLRSNMEFCGNNVKVIAIGIPTVVYASTIVSDIMDEVLGNADDELKQRIIASAEGTKGAELVVSPKDMDNLSEYSSRLIADAINMAVNPHISPEEIDAYMN